MTMEIRSNGQSIQMETFCFKPFDNTGQSIGQNVININRALGDLADLETMPGANISMGNLSPALQADPRSRSAERADLWVYGTLHGNTIMHPTTVSEDGIELVKRFEGLHKVQEDGMVAAYRCPAGKWTIGYGSTKGVRSGMKND